MVDKIVVDGRGHIRPYYFVPGVLMPFPSRRRREHSKNPNAAGQVVWVDGRHWGRVARLRWCWRMLHIGRCSQIGARCREAVRCFRNSLAIRFVALPKELRQATGVSSPH